MRTGCVSGRARTGWGAASRVAALVLGVAVGVHAAARAAGREPVGRSGASVAHTALRIVAGIRGSWSGMPANVVSPLMSPGALIGNGSLGVAIGGSVDRQQFYVGRDGFWSVLRGRIMPVGRLTLTIPALRGATARLRENIGPADVTARFVRGARALRWRAWVFNDRDLFAVQLSNPGKEPLRVRAVLRDAFGHEDLRTLSGSRHGIRWLRVSPETVRATIGAARPPGSFRPGIDIRSVQVLPAEQVRGSSGARPMYAWYGLVGVPKPFVCGDIIMPVRRFTVRAEVRLGGANRTGPIFAAVVAHRWMRQRVDPQDPLGNLRGHDRPRAQGALAGLRISIVHGRLRADLNGTVVTARQPLPLYRWIDVAVAYDGARLILLDNGRAIGATGKFPTAAEVMGPQWEWAATHPGDAHVPFDGIGPRGVLAVRALGADATLHRGATQFTVPAGGRVTVLVAAFDARDEPGYLPAAIAALRAADAASVAASWSRHLAAWHRFWSKSYVDIPNKTLEDWWYGSLYVLASCSRAGHVAPGLWGNWITSTHMGWQGDYTLDYNYEAPFWAAYPTNHVSLADPYDAPLLAWMARGRALAQKLHARGILYYTHLAPSPGWSADNFRALDQKSDALFAAVDCIQRWRYTRSSAYARKVWPFLSAIAEYWDHELKWVRGRYVDEDDAPDEHLWGAAHERNPATTLGFLRMLYPALIGMSRQLHTDRRQRAIWRHIVAHLSPLPIAPARSVAAIRAAVGRSIPPDTPVILQSERGMQWVDITHGERFTAHPPVRPVGSSAGMNSLQTVFPAWNIGLESRPALRRAALDTVNYMRLWYDSNDTSSFYPAAADVGYDPTVILHHLRLLVTHIGYANFAYAMPAGGVENEATVPTTIAAMLLQSYQRNIQVFADWPKGQDAAFGDLLAVGDFLVSSRIHKGQVRYVRIVSDRGGWCRLANPWGARQTVRLRIDAQAPELLRGAVLRIATHAGERLLFTRTSRPAAKRHASETIGLLG